MFSGKTDALVRRAEAAREAGLRIVVAKPRVDTRHPPDVLVAHSGRSIDAVAVASSADLLAAARGAEAVFVDEVQFFAADVADAIESLRGHAAVSAAGLDTDFRREPFATTQLLAEAADRVERLQAECGRCGRPATVTQRLVNGRPAALDDPVVRIGDVDLYEPRCDACWELERAT